MKIAYYTDQTYLHGGIERVLANKINYLLSNTDHEVYLITSEQKGNIDCYAMNDKVIRKDLKINYTRTKSYFHPTNLVKAPLHYFRLKKVLKDLNPDVLVSCNYSFDFFFIPFIDKKIKKIKEFHSSREFQFQERNSNSNLLKKLKFYIEDFVESRYDHLVLLTNEEKKYYSSDNLVVIPNALTNYPEKQAFLQNKKVISAGRVAPVKGFENLILAFEIVISKFQDWKLEVYGHGEKNYLGGLKMMVREKGLENNISFCGSTDNLMNEFEKSSIYVMSSHTECFPMVLLESLSIGLPVVSFDCPNGPRNIIKHNNDGILIEDQNVQKLADGLMTLISNSEERIRMGNNARKNVLRFKPEMVMKQWLDLFEN